MKNLAVIFAIFLFGSSTGHAAIVVNSFSNSFYSSDTAAMDLSLGISGYQIENFADTTLLPGLSFSLGDPNTGTFNALAATYNANNLGLGYNNDEWDDVNVLLAHPDNTLEESNRANEITFLVDGGTTSIGLGLSSFQSRNSASFPLADHQFFINGVDQGLLEDLPNWSSGLGKNVYLRIDADAGDTINSVSFRNVNPLGGTKDLLIFDHIAIASVPEPTVLIPIFIGTIGLISRRRVRRK